mmetsp:Transcript_30750/g.100075  ORF Transcript_30750/g.100075 Transcript_30750/m.100075 type:complete len:204 (+) Transcript_30750:1927-2538(+)
MTRSADPPSEARHSRRKPSPYASSPSTICTSDIAARSAADSAAGAGSCAGAGVRMLKVHASAERDVFDDDDDDDAGSVRRSAWTSLFGIGSVAMRSFSGYAGGCKAAAKGPLPSASSAARTGCSFPFPFCCCCCGGASTPLSRSAHASARTASRTGTGASKRGSRASWTRASARKMPAPSHSIAAHGGCTSTRSLSERAASAT